MNVKQLISILKKSKNKDSEVVYIDGKELKYIEKIDEFDSFDPETKTTSVIVTLRQRPETASHRTTVVI